MTKCECCGETFQRAPGYYGLYCPTCQASQDAIDSHIDGNHAPKTDPTANCIYCQSTTTPDFHACCMHEVAA